MTIRLNKVTRDLNVGISTVVEFLQKKGFAVEANPNTKINEEQYALLVKEFSTDKNLRLESERFIQERQNKDRNKASVSIDGYEAETTEKPKVEEIKTVVPEDARPKFKPVGKIDLDKLNRKPVVEKVEEKKVETSAPVVKEEPKPQPKPEPKPEFRPEPKPEPRPELKPEPKPEPKPTPAPEPAPVVKEEPKPAVVAEKPASNPAPVVAKEVVKKETPAPAAPVREEAKPAVAEEAPAKSGEAEIFTIHKPEFVSKINIIGQIDLATLNQSTRPKKKSKEEKRKEREEKEKIRQDQKKLMKEAIIKEIRREDTKAKDGKEKDADANANKKKRLRINNNKEKVDINNASNFQRGGDNRGGGGKGPHAGGGQQGAGGGNNHQGGNKSNRNNNNRDRFKKPVIKQEVRDRKSVV